MMNYPNITIPLRSEHLWRYTSWKRIHPTNVDEIPTADPVKFSEGEDSKIEDSDEIARSFIHSVSKICKRINLVGENKELDLRCSGHICAGELEINSKGDSSLILRISGDAGWTGIRLIGTVSGNLSVAVVNDLSKDGHFLRAEDSVSYTHLRAHETLR